MVPQGLHVTSSLGLPFGVGGYINLMRFKTLSDLQAFVADIQCSVAGLQWEIHCDWMGDNYYIQLRYIEPCIITGEPGLQSGRKWYVSRWSAENEVVQTVLKAALTSAEHMVREHFYYKGVRIFNPHLSLAALTELANHPTEARPPTDCQGA